MVGMTTETGTVTIVARTSISHVSGHVPAADLRSFASVPPRRSPHDSPPWRENAPSGRIARLDLRALLASRDLIVLLAGRDVKLRYRQAFFGVAWAVLQPLLGALLFAALFGGVIGVGGTDPAYFATVLTGFVLWTYVSGASSAAMDSLATNPALVTRVYFPRLAGPVASLLPGLVDFAVCLPLLVVVIARSPVTPGAAIVLAPLGLLLGMLTAVGVGTWLAALTIRYRDVRFAFPFLLQLWFFASPVVYSTSLIPPDWRWLYALNPIVGAIELLRWSLLGAMVDWSVVATSSVSAMILALAALMYFSATERSFADVV
jgi:ABC-type polysaccharide/polyol phosphate export permease